MVTDPIGGSPTITTVMIRYPETRYPEKLVIRTTYLRPSFFFFNMLRYPETMIRYPDKILELPVIFFSEIHLICYLDVSSGM